MILCIDTNTVVQALAEHHPFHPILDAWVAGHVTWAVSTPILLEYEEVLTRLSGPARWRKLARLMDLAEITSSNLLRVTPAFRFHVVAGDPDDNIFTDCAITANAEFLITEGWRFPAARECWLQAPIDFATGVYSSIPYSSKNHLRASRKLSEWLLNSGAYMHWISAMPVWYSPLCTTRVEYSKT